MKLAFAALAIGIATCSPHEARAESTDELLQQCEGLMRDATIAASGQISIPLTYTNGECWGYFDAVQGLSRLVVGQQRKRLLGICGPEATTLTQFIRVFMQYAQSHPEKLQLDAYEIVLAALQSAFPCR